MATLNQIYFRVIGEVPPSSISENDFFDKNLIEGKSAYKISIQAPPGTEVKLNNKRIIIGRSGLYDFDNENVAPITSLVFPTPNKFVREGIIEEEVAQLKGFLDSLKTAMNELDFTEEGAYEGLCKQGQEIYQGNRESSSDYNYEWNTHEPSKTLYGFRDVSAQYLLSSKGEIKAVTDDTSIVNVIINYVTD